MKKIFLIFNFLFLIFNSSFAQAPDWLWAKSIGGMNDQFGQSVAIDGSGNVYTTGRFSGTVDFDPGVGTFNLISIGNSHSFISKLDGSGNFVWAKAMGGTGGDSYGYSIIIDASGNIYTTGSFYGSVDFDPGTGIYNLVSAGDKDVFISKLDNSGNFVWAKAMGGTLLDYGYSITLDPIGSGDVYVTGFFNGTADFDPGAGTFNLTSSGTGDIFISRLNSSGNFVWAKAMGGASDDWGYFITLDASGNSYTTGFFSGTVDFDRGAGTFNLTSTGSFDVFLFKLDSSGNFSWAKAIGGTNSDAGKSISTDAADNVYLTGLFSGTVDFDPGIGIFNLTSVGGNNIFIAKLDASGNFVWAKSINGSTSDAGKFIVTDSSSNIYLTGLTPSGSGSDFFISKLDTTGNVAWTNTMGGIDSDFSQSIALNAFGNVYVTGYFQSASIAFGPITLTNAAAGTSDIFIAKLDITTGIGSEDNNNHILISPNPFTTQTTISFNKEVHNATFSLYNLLGEKVAEVSGINGERYQFNRGNLRSGVYVFEVREGKSIWRGKAVVF